MDIYWVKEGRRCGPATVPDVISLVHLGEISADTLGWHSGCASWAPLKELPALSDFLQQKPDTADTAAAPPPLPPVPAADAPETRSIAETEDEEGTPVLPEALSRIWLPTPGARLLARLVDIALYMGLVYSAIYVRQMAYNPNLLPTSPYFWLGFIGAEALLLSLFGTTPGKAFFHIRLIAFRHGTTEPLGFLRSLGRSLMVFVGGMGMMVSFLPFVMCGFSWWMLKRHGITYWDARMRTFPAQHRPAGPAKGILAAILLFVCMEVIGLCLQPWMPEVMTELRSQSPEAAETLQRWMPELPAAPPTAGELNERL